jgi:hypothetical protein
MRAGLLDLMFMMRSFHGPLPRCLPEFKAAVRACFPEGVYDTKYMASQEHVLKMPFADTTGTGRRKKERL